MTGDLGMNEKKSAFQLEFEKLDHEFLEIVQL